MKRITSIIAAVFTAMCLGAVSDATAQDSNVRQTTFLTFSGPVQMPGVTLPAGKYVFRLADPALHNVIQVFDDRERKMMGQWFYIPAQRTSEQLRAANGKPVVMFHEMPEGTTPAIRYFFYPTDLAGKEFIYPKNQALKIAAASHESVLATDSDVTKGGEAHVFRVEPDGTSASLEQQSSTDLNERPAAQPRGTSGQADQTPAQRQQASAELPKTASSRWLMGLIGLFALGSATGLKLARAS